MTNAIKEYKEYYTIYFKDGTDTQVLKEAYDQIKPVLIAGEQPFIEVGDSIYNRFEIKSVVKGKVTSDVEEFILKQPKQMRDKIKAYATSHKIQRNSIQHVQNFIDANG